MTSEISIFNAHFLWPRDDEPARPLAALIHLKFMDDFAERAARNEREGQHYDNAMKYRVINETLSEQPKQIAHHDRSARYSGPESLMRHNLLLPIDWSKRDDSPLRHLRSLGSIDFRVWSGTGNSLEITPSERQEFDDLAHRAFAAHIEIVRCRGHLGPGEIGLICILRNEASRLPLFLDHYKRLGVGRFFVVDNNSDDGTREILLAEPLADIFHAHASFSEGQAGLYWAQAVARHYGEGNWLMRPDGDELFVYDGMEERDLHVLASWLDRQGMDRVFAPMVDLYPSTALEETSRTIEDLIANDGWFDNDGYELEGWPQGWYLTGGPRDRLFSHGQRGLRTPIGKYPFFRMASDTLICNHHWMWPHDKVTTGALGAFLHLKFMSDFIERSERFEREGQHWKGSKAYKFMNERRREMSQTVPFHADSKRYRGPRSLIRHGMLMPIAWDA